MSKVGPDRIVRLGFFSSHGGSNFEAVVRACQSGILRGRAEPAVLIYNNPDAFVSDRADILHVSSVCLNVKRSGSEEKLSSDIIKVLESYKVDLIVLAGYMRKISPEVLRLYKDKILNIHPALLPKFGGRGMYGNNVHQAVIDAKEKKSGATVHLVTEVYDEGEILGQAEVEVIESDTAESLAKKVLKIEHELYSETIANFIERRKLTGN